jgi:hypothetical protein
MSYSNMQKLPKELAIIIPYATRLRNTITTLLDSNEGEFENIFNEITAEFLKYSVLVTSTLKDKQIEQIVAIYSSSLSQLKELAHDDPVVLVLMNANDMILDFFSLAFDPNILPQYADAFEPYLDLLVCCTVLLQVIENRNIDQRNVEKLTQRCRENICKLEGYIDTIEIESDPEQRAILEHVKSQ